MNNTKFGTMIKIEKLKYRILFHTIFVMFIFLSASAQNSMVGDGFGGRLWYSPVSYAVGSYTGYAICGANNQLYGWGSNSFGNLGNGQTTSTVTPVAVIGMTDTKFITSGYISAAIKFDSTGWVWGVTPSGFGGPTFTSVPQQVLTNVKFVDASAAHLSFVKYDGSVWSVGRNNGEFGNGTHPLTNTTTPTQMTGINSAVRVACGNSFTIVLLADSSVKQAGPGTDIFEATIHINSNGYLPEDVPVLAHNIVDIKANAYAAYALTSTGEVYSWGYDPNYTYGLLGNGPTHYDPQLIDFGPGAHSIVAISACCDGEGLLALDSAGNVFGCGWANVMGSGSNMMAYTPVLVNTNCKDIFCAETFSYIVKNDNSLWATGGSLSNYPGGEYHGSIFMNQPNITFPAFINTWVLLDPTGPPMNLCPPTVVPLKLISFEVMPHRNTVDINWVTEDLPGMQRFFVERSDNATSFKTIKIIDGTLNKINYKCIDEDPASGINYYRLRIRDTDGQVSYSEIRKIVFARKNTINIFPNPAKGIIKISVYDDLVNVPGILKITDLNGRLVLYEKINNFQLTQSINISKLQSGSYVVSISSDKEIFHQKIFVIN